MHVCPRHGRPWARGERLTAITPRAGGLQTVPRSRAFPLNETWLSAHVGAGDRGLRSP